MVRAVLRVVLDDEDQRRIRSLAARDPLDDQPEGIIVVGHLRLDRVHAVDRFVEVAEMVVSEAQQSQLRKRSGSLLLIIFALPFEHSPIIGELLVEAAEIGIAAAREQPVARRVDPALLLEGFADDRD